MRVDRLIVLAVLAAACSDSTSSEPRHSYSVIPASQWSGGTVTVRFSAFSGANLPGVYAGASALTVTRVDDTTLSIRLPVVATGDLALTRGASGHDTVGVVQVASR
jgi:hypothetical protein